MKVQQSSPRNILAIRFMRLGDVVLLLPALASLKARFPDSRITLLTDARCAPLAEMAPAVDAVIGLDRLQMRDGGRLAALNAIVRLAGDLRRKEFDLVIDFLSFRETNLLAWLSAAPHRIAMKRYKRGYLSFCFNLPPVDEDKQLHVGEMFQRLVDAAAAGRPAQAPMGPALVAPESARAWASAAMPAPFAALYVGAPVEVRRWPAAAFARLADYFTQELQTPVAILAGPSEADLAQKVLTLCRNPAGAVVFSGLSLQQLTALIARSRLLVSNDTGPMHIGPAVGVPTLGLFSVGYPEHYRPLGSRSRFLRANPIDRISPEEVIRTAAEMWRL